jgi:hypothetical protein
MKEKKHRFENLIKKALTKIYLWTFEWPKYGPYFQKSLHGSFFVGLMIFFLIKCMSKKCLSGYIFVWI